MLNYCRVHYGKLTVMMCMLCFAFLLIVFVAAAPADVLASVFIQETIPQAGIFSNARIFIADAAVDAGGKDGELLHFVN
jgi:hypothetical protein